MPYPDAPPYAVEPGAVTQPRQLQRWLDVNKVPVLTRTRGYFTLLAFSINTDWRGYSDIIGVYDYVAPNNFSLRGVVQPEDPTYVACIMWVDDEYNVHRYKLWEDVGEVFYFDIPLYTGQLIKKNFRIEIWSTEIEFTAFTLYGSVGGTFDGLYTQVSSTEYELTATKRAFFDGTDWKLQAFVFPNWLSFYTAQDFPFVWTDQAENPNGFMSGTWTQSTDVTFYTSVLGGYDYRFQDDFILVASETLVTDFAWLLDGGTFPLPFEWPTDSVPTLN